jgi:hypothetical protein
MLQNLHELNIRIREANESLDMQMLPSVWNDNDYRFHLCRITNGAHSEIRQVTIKTLRVFVCALQILLLS